MNKGFDVMTWYTSVIPIPTEIWSFVSWVAFFFKLVSLMFALPVIALLIFDICLWIWRLNRPAPQASPRPNKTSRSTSQKQSTLPTNDGTSGDSSDHIKNAIALEKRTGYSADTDR